MALLFEGFVAILLALTMMLLSSKANDAACEPLADIRKHASQARSILNSYSATLHHNFGHLLLRQSDADDARVLVENLMDYHRTLVDASDSHSNNPDDAQTNNPNDANDSQDAKQAYYNVTLNAALSAVIDNFFERCENENERKHSLTCELFEVANAINSRRGNGPADADSSHPNPRSEDRNDEVSCEVFKQATQLIVKFEDLVYRLLGRKPLKQQLLIGSALNHIDECVQTVWLMTNRLVSQNNCEIDGLDRPAT